LGRPPHQVWPWKNCAAAGLAERQSGAATAKAAITNEMRIEFSPSQDLGDSYRRTNT
jgi:hypothetical protein